MAGYDDWDAWEDSRPAAYDFDADADATAERTSRPRSGSKRAASRKSRRIAPRLRLVVLAVLCLSLAFFLIRVVLDQIAPMPESVSFSKQPIQISSDADDSSESSLAEDVSDEDTELTDEEKLQYIEDNPDLFPSELVERLESNPETLDYVYYYPELHDQTPEIDLSEEAAADEVPLLLQWDSRWGYAEYAGGLIGYTGCGPTCLSMVALYLTDDPTYTPLAVAAYAEEAGYCLDSSGTTWDLMREGCTHYGLVAEELSLVENKMIAALEAGQPLICNVGPGDFTDAGHYIVITGYVDGAFTICDPNSPQRSAQTWSFERLESQIKNIWAYSLA